MLLLAPLLIGWVCLTGGQDAPGTTVTSPGSNRPLDRELGKLSLVVHRPGVRVMRRRKQRRLDDSSVNLGTRNRVLGSRGERKWKRIRVRKKQRELLEKARSSGGESDATGRQQLNSVSGGRGPEKGTGRTEKLIEVVMEKVTEAVTVRAIGAVKKGKHLAGKIDSAVTLEFMKNALRDNEIVNKGRNRFSPEPLSDSSEHKSATISKSASIGSTSGSIEHDIETTMAPSETTQLQKLTTMPGSEKLEALSVTFDPDSEIIETTQESRTVTTFPDTTASSICSPVTMSDEDKPKSDAMETVSNNEMALSSNTTEPTPTVTTERRSSEKDEVQTTIQPDVSKRSMASSTESMAFISNSAESSRRSSSVYVDSSVIRHSVELRPSKFTAVRTAPSKTETEATTRSLPQTPVSDSAQVTTVSVTSLSAESEPQKTETPPSPVIESTTHTNVIIQIKEHTKLAHEDMELTIPTIPATPTVTAASTTVASSQIRNDGFKLNKLKDLETSLNEIETRPKKAKKAKDASLGFAGDNYLALRQKHKARSTTGSSLSTQTTSTIVPTTTRRTSKPPRRKTTKSGVHPDLQKVNILNNKIAMLKAELDLLLNFNENVLDFDSSIVSSAAKTKVEDFFLDLSNTIDDFMGPRKQAGSTSTNARISAAESVLTAGEDIATRLASTVELGSQVDISLANISMTVMKRRLEPRSVPSSSSWSSGLVEVELPDQVALAGKDNSISLSFSSFNNLGDLMTAESQVSSPVLSVSALGDPAGMETRGGRRWTELEAPIQFTARHGPVARHSAVSCVYWHFPSSSWATQGCTSRSFSPTATTCSCSHLTSFALLVLPPPPPPTWAPLTFYSGPPAVSRPTPTTEPVTEAWPEGWEEQLFYSAAPKYGERIRVTRRGREQKERAEKEEVDESGLAGVVWGGVILALTVICTSILLWDQRRRRRTGKTSSSSSTSSTHSNNMSQKGLKDEGISCYDDTFLTCLEQDVIV